MRRGALLAVLAAAGTAHPYPDGAPWGAADPDAAENCATCHFGGQPVQHSAALAIDGWPASYRSDEVYDLVLRFAVTDTAIAGAQLLARADGKPAGSFHGLPDDMESIDGSARSIESRPVEQGQVSWRLQWRAPAGDGQPVSLCVAALAANDDASAFGDRVHFRCFETIPAPPGKPR